MDLDLIRRPAISWPHHAAARLPHSALRDRHQIVVVGSGYGRGLAASRLARAGQQVCVLAHGREFQPGEFPDTELEGAAQTQAMTPQFDRFRVGSSLALMDWQTSNSGRAAWSR